jgi:hypothetical protein
MITFNKFLYSLFNRVMHALVGCIADGRSCQPRNMLRSQAWITRVYFMSDGSEIHMIGPRQGVASDLADVV